MRIVGCFLEYNGKFVILLRKAHKPNGGMWGLPAGKVMEGESDIAAVLREVREETGYHGRESELEHLGDFDFIDGVPYVFGAYRIRLRHPHKIVLEPGAHDAFALISAEDCYAKKDLILNFRPLLEQTGYV